MPFTFALALLNARDVTIGPAQFALFVFHAVPDEGVLLTVDVNAIVFAGFLFAVLSLIVARPPQTTPGSGSTTGTMPRTASL